MDNTNKVEKVKVEVKPDSKVMSDVSYNLKKFCDDNYLPILDNPKCNHLESFHNFLKKNFKRDEIKNIILEDYEDIGDIIN
jgi:hypothetical protein